jgi:hypothetical protein
MSARAFHLRHSLVIGVLLMFLYTWVDLSNSGVLPFRVPFWGGDHRQTLRGALWDLDG